MGHFFIAIPIFPKHRQEFINGFLGNFTVFP